jgi:diaminopimelate epimerase
MSLRFEKFHGIGNDFLVVEVPSPDALGPADAMRLCDRHFGIGGDGVLLVSPAESARARMTVLNADGSRPEMCGNGLRCVALYLARRARQSHAEFTVLTDAGPRFCHVEVQPNGTAGQVRSSMGRGELGAPFDHPFVPGGPSRLGSTQASAAGDLVATSGFESAFLSFHRVSVGNPHAVCFHEPITGEELDHVGSSVSAAERGGLNVEIVTQRGPRELEVAVWERGVGRTLACGTGAVGATVVAAKLGKVPFDEAITVRLPGGSVLVTVCSDLTTFFEGPAEFVFEGQTELAALAAPAAPAAQ